MRSRNPYCLTFLTLSLTICVLASAILPLAMAEDSPQSGAPDWSAVEMALSMHGEKSPDGTITFVVPGNFNVTMDGVILEPGSEMSAEFTFMKMDDEAMMVGEMPVLESEVAKVTGMLAGSGITQTALHNHLLGESPSIMWIHLHGKGDPVEMAKNLRPIIVEASRGSTTATKRASTPVSELDTAAMDSVLRANGTAGEGVYSYDISRAETITMDGTVLPPEMGISTEIFFQPIGNGSAAVTGEFVLTREEVEPVLRSLTGNGIKVTAIHNHMLTEEPRLFYMHYWAKGDATTIAGHLREALDKTNSK